jgi:LysM repeat protein
MQFWKSQPAPKRTSGRVVQRKKLHARAASKAEEIDDYEGESEPGMKLSQAFLVVLLLHVLAVGGIYGFSQFKEHSKAKIAIKAEANAAAQKMEADTLAAKNTPTVAEKPATIPKTYTVVAGDTLKKIASKSNTSIASIEKLNDLSPGAVLHVGQVLTVGTMLKTPEAADKTASSKTTPAPSIVAKAPAVKAPETATAKTPTKTEEAPEKESTSSASYIVAKGDTPISIAKKLKVSQETLMKANNIDDPRKLKIGQTIKVP